MPIAGLMSDQSGEWVDQKLTDIHEKAYSELRNQRRGRAGYDTVLHVPCGDSGGES